ncbi:MAG: B12-binding domain-containing radical SAM protein [Proteobacteria bacterium]|nr:B12-binding domain-containing radical SAM protein [Pseudomonadota bacterium]
MSASLKVLLVYPRFEGKSFWNYQATLEAVGKRYSNTPLGLITVAAVLPRDWELRLCDCNVGELTDEDLAWADVVFTGGMLPQQTHALAVVGRAQRLGAYVAVGGPDCTCSPEVYAAADLRVAGEVEAVVDALVEAVRERRRGALVRAEDFPDVHTSPVPRFDLLRLERYLHVGVQFSRGCPYACEFCNVIELNGRRPRTKTTKQVLAELQALYDLGWRGHVDFVDDNFIGNRREAATLCAALSAWLATHGQPFEFSTEVSVNLADSPALLEALRRANFFAVFVGIETPDPAALAGAGKTHNLNRDLVEHVRAIQRAGLFVNAGFIIGFDAETQSIARPMIDCIEAAAIPVCMVGLLYALPNTQLARRLAAEGRLEGVFDQVVAGGGDADQCTSGLNFRTRRPKSEALADYRQVLREIYAPGAFFGRVRRMVREMDLSANRCRQPLRLLLRDLRSFVRICLRAGFRDRAARRHYWGALLDALMHNPRGLRTAVSMAALYLHLGPFAQTMDTLLEQRVATLLEPLPT